MKEISLRIANAAFNPLLMPFYAAILPFIYADIHFISLYQNIRFLSIIFIVTYTVPMLLGYAYKMANGKLFHLNEHTQHLVTYLSAVFFNIALIYYLSRLGIPAWYLGILMATTILILAAALILVYWNISEQMLSIGGIIGATMCACYFAKGVNPFVLFIFLFLIAGLVGVSQLASGRKNQAQVYAGFISGLGISFGSVLLFLYFVYVLI
jgi:hypothetical protein